MRRRHRSAGIQAGSMSEFEAPEPHMLGDRRDTDRCGVYHVDILPVSCFQSVRRSRARARVRLLLREHFRLRFSTGWQISSFRRSRGSIWRSIRLLVAVMERRLVRPHLPRGSCPRCMIVDRATIVTARVVRRATRRVRTRSPRDPRGAFQQRRPCTDRRARRLSDLRDGRLGASGDARPPHR